MQMSPSVQAPEQLLDSPPKNGTWKQASGMTWENTVHPRPVWIGRATSSYQKIGDAPGRQTKTRPAWVTGPAARRHAEFNALGRDSRSEVSPLARCWPILQNRDETRGHGMTHLGHEKVPEKPKRSPEFPVQASAPSPARRAAGAAGSSGLCLRAWAEGERGDRPPLRARRTCTGSSGQGGFWPENGLQGKKDLRRLPSTPDPERHLQRFLPQCTPPVPTCKS